MEIVFLVRTANTDPETTWKGEVSTHWTMLLS